MKYDEQKMKNIKYNKLTKRKRLEHSLRVSKVYVMEMRFSPRSAYLESHKIEVLTYSSVYPKPFKYVTFKKEPDFGGR